MRKGYSPSANAVHHKLAATRRQRVGDPPGPPDTLYAAMRPFVELYRVKFIEQGSGQTVVMVPAVWLRDLSIAFARVCEKAESEGPKT